MIIMQDVHKTYPNGVTALNGVDVRIKQGEFVYIVGPSGAGKSTFIRLMYLEEKATDGQISIIGQNATKLKSKDISYIRRDIGVVFQDFKLLPRLTVYEYVAFALEVIQAIPISIRNRV